ncbi:MAG: hypothetical protein ACR2PG_13410 [Hyphomicrobiaceae bacterium]
MTIRTVRRVMTFVRPFRLAGTERPFAAGTYDVATEEELLDGLSFPAFRRLQTYLTRRVTPDSFAALPTVVVDLDDLARVFREDQISAQRDC